MILHTLKEAVKKICPEFILRYYRNAVMTSYWKRIDATNRKYAYTSMTGGGLNHIEIETVNRCNGICPFCPVNVNQPQRPYAKMSEELFRKIIDDLAKMNYSKGVALFSNNEPFLDERITEFQRYASEKLPNAVLWLFTNGKLLTFEKFIEILPYLDNFIIDNYNDKKELNSPELKKIYDYVQEHQELSKRVLIYFRLQNEVLTSRGGQAPNKQGTYDKFIASTLCTLPFKQLIIRPTGEVSLCCNDALGKYTLGDLRTQTISEVWNSEKHKAICREMLANGRKNLMLCRNCDHFAVPEEEFTERQRP